jgi:hypothetical protein
LRAENAELKNILQEYEKTGLSVPGASDTQVSSPPTPKCLLLKKIHACTWFFSLGKILILCSPGNFWGDISAGIGA